jgi:hypothetical protein
MLIYIDIIEHISIQILTVTEIMARENYVLLPAQHILPVKSDKFSVHCAGPTFRGQVRHISGWESAM